MNTTAAAAKAAVALLCAAMIAVACGAHNNSGSSHSTASPGSTDAGGGAGTTVAAGAPTMPVPASGGTVTIALPGDFSGYNQGTSAENTVANQWVTNQVIPSFVYFDGKGVVQVDKNLADITKTGDSPLTVHVTINPRAVWSDGVPISCDDIYLYWVAQNGKLARKDDSGKDVGLFSNATTAGFDQVKDVSCSADNRDTTIVFDTPYSDWLGLITNQGMVPAHAVARLAGLADANAIRAAYESNDAAALGKVADAWNTGFRTDQGLKPDVMLSGGPYRITEYVPDESVTLERNDKFWGTPGGADKVVFRIITDHSALLSALVESEVQVIALQPDLEVLNELKGVSNVSSSVNGGFTFEHFDFNFQNALFRDKAVRQAVAYCIGRSEMVDQLIKPLNDKAEVLQNRMFEPFQKAYVDNSGGEYDHVDIAKAKATLEAAGYTLNGNVFEKNGRKVEFTLLHKDTARRSSEQQLISDSCAKAGISVLDDSDPNWSDRIADGQFDAVVFAWTGSPRLSANRSIYKTPPDKTTFNQNFGSYANPEVDALMDTLATETDPAKRDSAANQADKLIWEDLGTIPLFQFPELVAFSDTISNVVYNPTQFGITWNDNDWVVD